MMAMRAARLGAHVAHGAGRIARDAALGGRRRLPRRRPARTPAALSRVLGRPVESASVVAAESGTSSRARLTLTGPDLPGTVFVKVSAATAATRMLGELARLGETEARFYRDLAHELGDGVPRS